MYHTTQTIELDGMETECALVCEVDYCRDETGVACTIIVESATIEGMATYDRKGLIALIGDAEVNALEDRVSDEWLDANDAGDWRRIIMTPAIKALRYGLAAACGWLAACLFVFFTATPSAFRDMSAPPCLNYPGASASGAFLAVMK